MSAEKMAKALRDAATSLETICRLAGRAAYLGDDGEKIPTCMEHHDEVRSYAKSRTSVAKEALVEHEAERQEQALEALTAEAEVLGLYGEADKLVCPVCASEAVVVTEETKWMVNTGEHYCYSVKAQDDDAEATCLKCQWAGRRENLKQGAKT